MDNCLRVSLRTGVRRCLMSLTSVSIIVILCLLRGNDFGIDMINMMKLGYTPHACCWVHRRGQAQGLLAMWVLHAISLQYAYSWGCSSDKNSGTIRIYDGRGNGEPLETIEKLHRSPVHIMTVRLVWSIYIVGFPNLLDSSIAIDSIQSFQQTKRVSLNTGSLRNHSNFPRTFRDCGRSKAKLTCMSLRK